MSELERKLPWKTKFDIKTLEEVAKALIEIYKKYLKLGKTSDEYLLLKLSGAWNELKQILTKKGIRFESDVELWFAIKQVMDEGIYKKFGVKYGYWSSSGCFYEVLIRFWF